MLLSNRILKPPRPLSFTASPVSLEPGSTPLSHMTGVHTAAPPERLVKCNIMSDEGIGDDEDKRDNETLMIR